jgi:hypothetical protein
VQQLIFSRRASNFVLAALKRSFSTTVIKRSGKDSSFPIGSLAFWLGPERLITRGDA